jgi:putative spermidine/putrescine transport system substrate-binding protein
MHLQRKQLTGSTIAAIALLFAGASLSAAESLTVVSWGGAYTSSQVKAYHEPFTKKTGVKILSEDYNDVRRGARLR